MEGLVGTVRDEVGKKAARDLKGLAQHWSLDVLR